MKPMAVIGALVGAAVGAGIWAAIALTLDMEIGLVAWGIGGLVGGGAYALGGRGPISGGTAAALALVAILGGKLITVDIALDKYIAEEVNEATYSEFMGDARDFPGSDADDETLRQYAQEHGFVETGEAEDLAMFREYWGPWLERLKREEPDYDTWHAEEVARRRELVADEVSTLDILKEGFGLFDLLFAFLGVSTAFKLAGQPEEDFFSGKVEDDSGSVPPPGDPGAIA